MVRCSACMGGDMSNGSFFAVVATAVLLGSVSTAGAIDKCRVKIDKKTGVIRVDASGIAGPLTWGPKAGSESGTFHNAATCISGPTARKCELADPSTLAAKTPPAGCSVYLTDGVTPCSGWISGCSPAPRESGGLLWKDSNGVTVGYAQDPGATVVRNDGSVVVSIPTKPDGSDFAAAGTLFFTSADCSGPPMFYPSTSAINQVQTLSSTGPAYYPVGSGTMVVYGSILIANDRLVDQAACDVQNGPGNSNHVAPLACCVPETGIPNLYAPMATTDLTGFTPPFHLEDQ